MFRRTILVGLLMAASMAASLQATVRQASPPSAVSAHTSITIVAPPVTTVGVPCCITVVLGSISDEFSYSVEILGKAVESHLTRVSPGVFVLCFVAPPGSSGLNVDVTVSSTGQSTTTSISVI
jgi:hypothetical protein